MSYRNRYSLAHTSAGLFLLADNPQPAKLDISAGKALHKVMVN